MNSPDFPMLRRLLALSLLTFAGLHAQTATDQNLGSKLTVDGSTSPATYTFSWWGKSGCYYLVKTSPDLMTWTFLPNFNPAGADAVLSVQFTTDAGKYFFRAIQLAPGDTSGALDSDGNGLPDPWELYYFGHIGVDPNANPFGDGMSNLYKYAMGLNPLVNELNNDKDGDGVLNYQDARPNNPAIGILTVTIAAPLNGAVFQ